jgi:CRISPR system Cascade subunit CasC
MQSFSQSRFTSKDIAMANFLQLHFLTTYAPSNLNRDDTGRPKSAIFGGVNRLRVSSQSLKRAWRSSEVFERRLNGHLASRTQRLGKDLLEHLKSKGMADGPALKIAASIAGIFGKLKNEKDAHPEFIEQLAFVSPEERSAALALADKALAGEVIKPGEDDILRKADTAADIAMFGRMMASSPKYNREAAVQVAHALTTHKSVAEDDYYTAVDDLKTRDEPEDMGAGFVGVQEFGAGVFYIYICVDRDLLLKNLGGNRAVRDAALAALVEAAATVGPNGKQNSFASRAYASYALGETGPQQPRSLAATFLKPVSKGSQHDESVEELEKFRSQLNDAYGACADNNYTMNVTAGKGTLAGLVEFALK